MGLLHSVTHRGARQELWELTSLMQQLAQELGVPLPPEVSRLVSRLPDIAAAIGSGNPAALLGLLGPELASALGAELQNPALQALVRGDLEGARDALTDYAANLTGIGEGWQGQLSAALSELGGLTGQRANLQGLLNLATSLPGALADVTGAPVLGSALDLLSRASPEVAQVLRMAVNAADTLDGQIASAQNLVGDVQGRLARLGELGEVAGAVTGQLNAHLGRLDDLFDSARGLLGGTT